MLLRYITTHQSPCEFIGKNDAQTIAKSQNISKKEVCFEISLTP